MTYPSVPMSPEQAKALQHQSIPPFVFEECNRLLTASLSSGRASVSLPKLLDAVFARTSGMADYSHIRARNELPSHWTSPENIHRTYSPAGWDVVFDRPAYFESGESTFYFSERR